MRSRILTIVVVAAALAVPPGLAGAAPSAPTPGRETPPSVPLVVERDRNGDGVSDDLEADLRGAAPAERFRVIVTGVGSAAGRRLVGPFLVKHELSLINGFAATMTVAQVRALARHPLVHRVEADGIVRALDDATDRDFGAAAAREAVEGLDGSGVGICVIDTGIDPNHEQIAPRTVVFKDYVNARTTAYDDHGHGTHVAAIAAGDGAGGASAATFVGVAPAADLYAAKVLNSQGSGADSDVAAAVQWCHGQPGVDVLSLSLGSPGTDGNDAVSLAVDEATSGGDVVVVAAGNSGDVPGTITAPGVAAGAVTVGAVADHSAPPGTPRRDNGIWLAAFSSRGPTLSGLIKPDIAAPGVTVTAAQAGTTAGYVTYSGTSMATPFVSGAVALALEVAPTASPTAIKDALKATAVDVGPGAADNDWGAGLVDVAAFVDRFTAVDVGRTVFPEHQRVTGTVATGGTWTLPVTVADTDLGVPLAVTLTIDGELACASSFIGICLGYEWSPDLEMRLLDPAGTRVALSECPLSGVSCSSAGRQETIGFLPASAGEYRLEVFPFAGSPNNGKGGSFGVDVFHGPLGGGGTTPTDPPPSEEPANQSPVADAGEDLTVKIAKKATEAAFTLDGTGSNDPDAGGDEVLDFSWTDELGAAVGTAATVDLQRPEGTYEFTLVVTDVDGASSAPDTVTVTVVRSTTGRPPRR